jgi:predicted phage tail protein
VSGTGFSISGLTPPLTLTPGQSFTFGITFAPQTSGSATGSLVLTSDGSSATLTIPLSGTATALGQLAISPTTLSFGSVSVGSSKASTATLTASGTSVTVSSITPSTAEFTVSGVTLPLTIAAGQSASFTVTFSPQASGTASASLSVASNASNSPTTQTLTGTGVVTTVQHSVDLSWVASTSTVSGYNIYRRALLTDSYTKLNSSLNPGTSYTDSTVQSGKTYYYSTTAVDASGKESAHSNEVPAVVPTP